MEAATFATQANALLRKSLTFQKRNVKTNLCLLLFPVLLCLLLWFLQNLVDSELAKSNRCGCRCLETRIDGTCASESCTADYSSLDQAPYCAIPSPHEWAPLLQVPRPEFRADAPSSNFTREQCRRDSNCPVTVLLTGGNSTFALDVAAKFFSSLPIPPPANISRILSTLTLGSDNETQRENFLEPEFLLGTLYSVQPECPTNFPSAPVLITENIPDIQASLKCVQAMSLWHNSSSIVNSELYNGYTQANPDSRAKEYMAAYDFLDSNASSFNVRIWYNSTYRGENGGPGFGGFATSQLRIVRSVNLISNAYIKYLKSPNTAMQIEFIKEMPKPETRLGFDISSILGPLFFNLVIELIFPVLLTCLVYEKQYKLRIMMKMHGLGDGPYWLITYVYFLILSVVYILFFVVFGALIGLKFFTLQDYSLQFVFYFAFANLQIALAFFAAIFFNKAKSAQGTHYFSGIVSSFKGAEIGATAVAYIYIFGSGLLAGYFFNAFIEDPTFSKSWIRVMELLPAFSLYRIMYEFGQYSFNGRYMGMKGMQWKDLKDDENGMMAVLIIVVMEWLVLLPLAYYLDQLSSKGGISKKSSLFLTLKKTFGKSFKRQSFTMQGSRVFVEVDKPDVAQEREIVERLRSESSNNYAIISDNLKKVYQGKDGNPDKLAVQGLSLALPHGECFGMLGPNGAGKTTFINMMIGLTASSSGNAYVEGHSIHTDMNKIYTSMGVCPQHDMLWEILTGREHLLFYGRLKNLKGHALTQAIEESLKSVNLFHGGVGDKQARKYSGGMKRRLSVAISLIGNPKVVYMDEPSTGLDPASRNCLWNVMKKAKENRVIILTTHSMEEAEVLCDRLGIFVGGALQCIGDPKQLKARYGGTYVFTMTTSPNLEKEVESLVFGLSHNAIKVYHIPGTQKFEIPKQDVRIDQVFKAVEEAKRRFPIQAWGLANTTLEDVFIKVAKEASSNYELS